MRKHKSFFSAAQLTVFILIAASTHSALGQEEEPRPKSPGFRTDLGIQLSVGGHQCLRSGSGYAECRGADGGWNTSVGIAGGFIVRPIPYFSAGLDAAYMHMTSRWNESTYWSDISAGPVLRAHLPIRIKNVVLEPHLGAQGGFIQGNMHFKEDGNRRVNQHTGLFVAPLGGLDIFVLPGFGFGIDVRVIRTFYQEVCFESSTGTICRGTNDTQSNSCGTGDQHSFYPGDGSAAQYPWKIFYGGHLLYYF